MAISLTAFRQNLYNYVKDVLADETGSLTITSREGEVELVNSAELRSLREFHHLFSSPANSARLLKAIEDTRSGNLMDISLEDMRRKLDA